MVTFINESAESLESIFNEFDASITEACNECEYAVLSEQYNYVCENGVMMPINEADEKKESLLVKLISFLIDDLIKLKNRIVGWCKSHYKGSELDQMINAVKSKFSKGKKNIESASTPEEAKAASKEAAADMKKQTSNTKGNDKVERIEHKSDGSTVYRNISSKETFEKALKGKNSTIIIGDK